MLLLTSDMDFLDIKASDAVLTLKPSTTTFEALRGLLVKIEVFRGTTLHQLLNSILAEYKMALNIRHPSQSSIFRKTPIQYKANPIFQMIN
jgi:hypothetical protein